MLKVNHLSAEDAAAILELSKKIDITVAERLAKAVTDRKFYIETSQGEKRLLGIYTTEHYDWLECDFRIYEYAAASRINIMQPISMGTFNEGKMAYQLYTWFDGEDLAEALPRMNPAEQFSAGIKTGELLQNLHALPPLYESEPWGIRFKREVQEKIQSYNRNPSKSQSADLLVRYLQDNEELLDNRSLAFTHGNYNTSNLMLASDGKIGIIDLGGGGNCNDPWWDFWEIPDDANSQAHFYTGQIKGYFKGEPPAEYFPLLAYYMAFGRLKWEYDYQCILNWFDDMRNLVPTWYLKDYTAV